LYQTENNKNKTLTQNNILLNCHRSQSLLNSVACAPLQDVWLQNTKQAQIFSITE